MHPKAGYSRPNGSYSSYTTTLTVIKKKKGHAILYPFVVTGPKQFSSCYRLRYNSYIILTLSVLKTFSFHELQLYLCLLKSVDTGDS